MNGIPKYVQVLQKLDPPEDLKEHLREVFSKDGVEIDEDMRSKNPNARTKMPFISVTANVVSSTKAEFDGTNESMGYWKYCGNLWYVRNNEGIFEYAQYMAYSTEKKVVEDIWDHEKYKELNG